MNRQRMNNSNKKYKELKQKQKARISDLMYRETDRFLQEKKQPPDDNEVVQSAERVYCRIQGLGFWMNTRKNVHIFSSDYKNPVCHSTCFPKRKTPHPLTQ